ncbi:hypothetical protein ACJMK2_029638 [Sinanodonta woodiana]|uniref:Uncharacterized protein n=1 Tax=Sinanodonta woodiana TaxID=1069815 RepID=A0ABD3XEG4_SINWO
MEVNPRLQNAIAAHHIIQVVSAVAIIIYVAVSIPFIWMSKFLTSGLGPIYVFIIFWIASKCSYKDLRLILVHFNTLLCMMWITVFSLFGIISQEFSDGRVPVILVIIFGFLCLTSVIFATYGIWKSARKVILSDRLVQRYEVLDSLPPNLE